MMITQVGRHELSTCAVVVHGRLPHIGRTPIPHHYGQRMYIGSELESLAKAAGLRVHLARSVDPAPDPATIALLHRMNIETWRSDAYVRANVSSAQIDSIHAALSEIAAGARPDTKVRQRLRQSSWPRDRSLPGLVCVSLGSRTKAGCSSQRAPQGPEKIRVARTFAVRVRLWRRRLESWSGIRAATQGRGRS